MFCLKPLTQNKPKLINQEDIKQTTNGCIFAAAGLASLCLPPPNWAVALLPGLVSGISVFFFLCSLYAFALVSRQQTAARELFYFKAHEAKLIRITTVSFAIIVAVAGTMEALYQCHWSDTRSIVEKLRLNRVNAPGGAIRVQVSKNLRLAASLSLGNQERLNRLTSYAVSVGLEGLAEEIRREAETPFPTNITLAWEGLLKTPFIQADTYRVALWPDETQTYSSPFEYPGFPNRLNSEDVQQALWNATNDIRIDGRPENYVRRAKIYDAMGLTQQAKQDLIMAESIDNDSDRFLLTAR